MKDDTQNKQNAKESKLQDKKSKRNKDRHYIIKGTIHQEDITFTSMYVEAPRYIKQLLTDCKGEIDSHTII